MRAFDKTLCSSLTGLELSGTSSGYILLREVETPSGPFIVFVRPAYDFLFIFYGSISIIALFFMLKILAKRPKTTFISK